MSGGERQTPSGTVPSVFGLFESVVEYMTDATQRSVLFLDVLRQRGNNYREHAAKTAPHVLNYDVELVIDGRTLDRPVNYALVRVIPPKGTRSIQRSARLWSWIRELATVPGSADSSPTARSEWLSRRGILVISSDFCRSRCPVKRSRILRTPRRSFSKR